MAKTVKDKDKDKYKYHLFISYASKDRDWAMKLYADLRNKGLEPFLDFDRIEVGHPWEVQLNAALGQSRHFAVLWSDHAKTSPWVMREQATFVTPLYAAKEEGVESRRRFITIELQGKNVAYPSFQTITELARPGVYDAGAEQVDPVLWQRVIDKLERGIRGDDGSVPVPVLVLTTTKPGIAKIDPNLPQPLGSDLDEFLRRVGVGADRLLESYGEQRDHWRPFGGEEDIWTLLNKIRDEINVSSRARGDPTFRWEPLGEEFWSADITPAECEAKKLESVPSVVVIDPLALYDPQVQTRLNLLHGCLDNRMALIMVLSPSSLPSPCAAIRTLVKQFAKRIYEFSFEPPWRNGIPFATCSAQTIDSVEVRRLLLTALAPQISRPSRKVNPVLRI